MGDAPFEHIATLIDHGDYFTEVLDEVELVAGESTIHPSVPLPQRLGQAGHGERIQAVERLVEDDDVRIVNERRRHLETLLHSAGELVGAVVPSDQPDPSSSSRDRACRSPPPG